MKEPGQQRSEQLVGQLADWIGQRRLALPAILMLEVTKPFSFIASQGLLLVQPLVAGFYDGSGISDYAHLLADRSNVEQLIACLEDQEIRGRKESDR